VSLLAAVDQVRARLGSRVKLLGVLLMCVKGGQTATEATGMLRAQHRDRVFHTEILESSTLEEAPARGKTIFQHAPRSRAADAFRRLSGEVLERLRDLKK
jgi:chromosome partitioning protein